MNIRLSRFPYDSCSTADGPGFRFVVWNQGCKIHCPGCHNPLTWEIKNGDLWTTKEIIELIEENKHKIRGITLSGGDPFLQPEANANIAIAAHYMGLDVWAYCGLTFEEILKDRDKTILLKECDVLVDGPFIMAERDISLPFRGSRNQRIIDVQKSLRYGEVVLLNI